VVRYLTNVIANLLITEPVKEFRKYLNINLIKLLSYQIWHLTF